MSKKLKISSIILKTVLVSRTKGHKKHKNTLKNAHFYVLYPQERHPSVTKTEKRRKVHNSTQFNSIFSNCQSAECTHPCSKDQATY